MSLHPLLHGAGKCDTKELRLSSPRVMALSPVLFNLVDVSTKADHFLRAALPASCRQPSGEGKCLVTGAPGPKDPAAFSEHLFPSGILAIG